MRDNNLATESPTMKRAFYIGTLVSLSLCILTFFITTQDISEKKNTTIKVAIMLPVHNAQARSIIEGADVLFSANNTVGGKKIASVIMDTGDAEGNIDPKKEKDAIDHIISDQSIIAVIGPFTTESVEKFTPQLNKELMVTIVPYSTDAHLTHHSIKDGFPRSLFPNTITTMARMIPSADVIGAHFDSIMKEYSQGLVYVYGNTSNLSTSIMYGLRKKNLPEYIYTDSKTITELTPKTPSTFFITTSPEDIDTQAALSYIAKLSSQEQYRVVLNHRFDNTFALQQLSATFAGKIYLTSLGGNEIISKEYNQDFLNTFNTRYGYSPDTHAFAGYDSARLAVDIIQKSPVMTRGAHVTSLLRLPSLEGSYQKMTLNTSGDIKNVPVTLYEIIKGEKRYIQTYHYEQ